MVNCVSGLITDVATLSCVKVDVKILYLHLCVAQLVEPTKPQIHFLMGKFRS